MPAPRIFTPAELDRARALRRNRASWRSVGRELRCHEDTIRAAIDPDFDNAARLSRIVALKRARRTSLPPQRPKTIFGKGTRSIQTKGVET